MGKSNPRNSGGPGMDGQTIFLAVILVAALSVLGTVQIGAVASWKPVSYTHLTLPTILLV